jgi:hypothetical protein
MCSRKPGGSSYGSMFVVQNTASDFGSARSCLRTLLMLRVACLFGDRDELCDRTQVIQGRIVYYKSPVSRVYCILNIY